MLGIWEATSCTPLSICTQFILFFEFKHNFFLNFIDDADNVSGDGLDEGDDPEGKAEYVKKVFVA